MKNNYNLKQALLENLYSAINSDTLNKQYYKPLPKELEKWYVFTMDGGHNIFILLKCHEDVIKNNPEKSYEDYMMPCPVKTVLCGYTVNEDGIIIVDIPYNVEIPDIDCDELTEPFYCPQIGLVTCDNDTEYQVSLENYKSPKSSNYMGFGFNEIDDNLVSTGYFDSEYNSKGYFYLLYNNKCFYLFVPDTLNQINMELKTGKYVVLTTGNFDLYNRDMVELMFEDFSDDPYCLHLSKEQLILPIDDSFHRKKFKLKVLCREGIVMETEIYIRSKQQYQLPYLKPIDIKYYDAA